MCRREPRCADFWRAEFWRPALARPDRRSGPALWDEAQKCSLIPTHLSMESASRLAIVIHWRPSENSENAWEDCLALIDQHWKSGGMGGVLHCFTGSWAHAKRALDMGFRISFAGNITFPKGEQIREAAKQAPL